MSTLRSNAEAKSPTSAMKFRIFMANAEILEQ